MAIVPLRRKLDPGENPLNCSDDTDEEAEKLDELEDYMTYSKPKS
jgi:hypothetical protein